jgi:hypothetical protein
VTITPPHSPGVTSPPPPVTPPTAPSVTPSSR